MARTLLKILYAVFVALIGVVFAIINYRSNAYNIIYNKTQNYIKNEEYTELVRTYCGYFDSQALELNLPEKNSNFKLKVFNGTQEESAGSSTSISYYYHDYSYAYYFILTNVEFQTVNVLSDTTYNNTGIRFIDSVNNKTYDYKFRISSTVNAKDYKAKEDIQKIEDKTVAKNTFILNSERELITFNNNWGFYRIIITENIIDAIEATNNMTIDSFNILNNMGEKQFKEDVTFGFKFDQQFFNDITPVKVAYNSIFPISDGYNSKPQTNTKEEFDNAKTTYEARIKDWENELKANPDKYKNYLIAYKENEVLGNSAIGPTIGVMAIYIVVIILLFILLFEFKRIRALIERFRDRKQTRYIPNKMPEKKNQNINEDKKEIENKNTEDKE